jgi:hypothetical protein
MTQPWVGVAKLSCRAILKCEIPVAVAALASILSPTTSLVSIGRWSDTAAKIQSESTTVDVEYFDERSS